MVSDHEATNQRKFKNEWDQRDKVKKARKLKTYTVVRIVKEEFEVQASSKQNVMDKIENPYCVTVVREKITLNKK